MKAAPRRAASAGTKVARKAAKKAAKAAKKAAKRAVVAPAAKAAKRATRPSRSAKKVAAKKAVETKKKAHRAATPARKAVVKKAVKRAAKAPAKKAPAKKAAVKRTVALGKKTPAKKAVVKRSSPAKTPAKKAVVKKARKPIVPAKAPARKPAPKRARHETRADKRQRAIHKAQAHVDRALAQLFRLLDTLPERRRKKYAVPAPIIGRPTEAKVEARYEEIRATAEAIRADVDRQRKKREREERQAEKRKAEAAKRARERREREAERKEKERPVEKPAKEKPIPERLIALLREFGRPAFEPSIHVFRRTNNVHVFVNVPIPYGLRDRVEDVEFVALGAEEVMYPQVWAMRDFRVWFRISIRMTVLKGYEDNYKKLKGQESIVGSWKRGEDFPHEFHWAREEAMPNAHAIGHEITSFVVEAWYGKKPPHF